MVLDDKRLFLALFIKLHDGVIPLVIGVHIFCKNLEKGLAAFHFALKLFLADNDKNIIVESDIVCVAAGKGHGFVKIVKFHDKLYGRLLQRDEFVKTEVVLLGDPVGEKSCTDSVVRVNNVCVHVGSFESGFG